MSRTTAILALVQVLLVVLGFFALGIVLKGCGYPHTIEVRWNPLAVLLREHGIWLLFLPLVWVVFAISAQRIERNVFSPRVAFITGLSIASAITALFLYAAIFPYTRPLLFQAH